MNQPPPPPVLPARELEHEAAAAAVHVAPHSLAAKAQSAADRVVHGGYPAVEAKVEERLAEAAAGSGGGE